MIQKAHFPALVQLSQHSAKVVVAARNVKSNVEIVSEMRQSAAGSVRKAQEDETRGQTTAEEIKQGSGEQDTRCVAADESKKTHR